VGIRDVFFLIQDSSTLLISTQASVVMGHAEAQQRLLMLRSVSLMLGMLPTRS
jgi:hypothetical protein